MSRIVRVLIVDDSAFVRKVVKQMLQRSPFLEVVGTAYDGEEALQKVEELNPDVVTLDLNMPRSSGIDFLRTQMQRRPIPVVVLSNASETGDLVMQALDAGAVDVVRKPTALANDKVFEIADDLVAKVKAIAFAGVKPRVATLVQPLSPPKQTPRSTETDIVLIGVSTGGPQALKRIIPQFPKNFPVPIAMVLHMPVGFTDLFARNLNDFAQINVTEARDGDLLRAGSAVLAPAGQHMSFARTRGGVISRLTSEPADSLHRPSVDVMFRSAAEVFGSRALSVVLTGMGSDGTSGAAWIKAKGGRVFTEAEESCVVYGMPRSVVEAGLSDRMIPLDRMAEAILGAL
ncbi:MAG: chemotaxis response regulator protein-glutamate methylesterase [Gemmataceae bacterium]